MPVAGKVIRGIFDKGMDAFADKDIGALKNLQGYAELIGYHASPEKIVGDFRQSDVDLGTHFAASPELAVNASIKSSQDKSSHYMDPIAYKFKIDAKPEQITEIKHPGGRIDWLTIVEELNKSGKIPPDKMSEITNGLIDIEKSDNSFEDMMFKMNEFLKNKFSELDIKAIKYFNDFDSGPNWREMENIDSMEDLTELVQNHPVKPDYSYMVFDPSIVKKVEE